MKFESVRHALWWYTTHNPARYKPVNLLEVEHQSPPAMEQFSGDHAIDVFASIACGLENVLERYKRQQRAAYTACEIGAPPGMRHHPDDVAGWMRLSPATVYRWLKEIRRDIEREFRQRDLLT